MLEFLKTDTGLIIILFVNLLLFVSVIISNLRINSINKNSKDFMRKLGDGKDIKEDINKYMDRIVELETGLSETNTHCKQKEALLNVILLDQKSNNDYVSDIKPTNITIKDIFKTNKLDITKDTTIIYELPKKYKNKIILISLDVSSKNESIIKINNVSNNTKDNKLYYIISEEELNELYIHLPKNTYTISNLEISYLDPAHIENINSNIDKLVIDHNNSKGDTLQGTIEVTKDSYLTLLLPYKKGFNIYVDGELTEYQETNNNNIGLPIKTGIHDIEIEYQVPYKSITIVVSTLGILILCTVTYLEYKRKF